MILGYQVCGLRADAQEVVVRVRHRMSHLRTGVGVPNTNSPISDKKIDETSVRKFPGCGVVKSRIAYCDTQSRMAKTLFPGTASHFIFLRADLHRWAVKSHLDPEQIFSGASGHVASPLTVSS